jgi:16S rRNA (uracil1498-N3)-methyltransferase
MSVSRFFLPPAACAAEEIQLTEGEAHHARHVLRIKRDDAVEVLDGAGGRVTARVVTVSERVVRLAVVQRRHQPEPPCGLCLVQAVLKPKAMDLVLQKATELGCRRIVPVLSERVVSRMDPPEAERRAEKWRQVAVEAMKQCGAPWLPIVEAPRPLAGILNTSPLAEISLLASLRPAAARVGDILDDFAKATNTLPARVALWIGPEGDFTPAELDWIEASGARPVTLGTAVLRSETAALCGLAIIGYELQARAARCR